MSGITIHFNTMACCRSRLMNDVSVSGKYLSGKLAKTEPALDTPLETTTICGVPRGQENFSNRYSLCEPIMHGKPKVSVLGSGVCSPGSKSVTC
jgi:hypothetical protein